MPCDYYIHTTKPLYERFIITDANILMVAELQQTFFDKLFKRKKFKIQTNGDNEEIMTEKIFKFLIFKGDIEFIISDKRVPAFENLISYLELYNLDKYDLVIEGFDNLIDHIESEYRKENDV